MMPKQPSKMKTDDKMLDFGNCDKNFAAECVCVCGGENGRGERRDHICRSLSKRVLL